MKAAVKSPFAWEAYKQRLTTRTQTSVLIIGAGEAGARALSAILKRNAKASVTLVGEPMGWRLLQLAEQYQGVQLHERSLEPADLKHKNLIVIADEEAGDLHLLSAKKSDINLLARRPLWSHTAAAASYWKQIATFFISAFALLALASVLVLTGAHTYIGHQFWAFLLVGFIAQMVDGMLGMGYGVTSAIGLLTLNINASVVSSAIHTAEVFTAGASGYSHYRFGNINKKLFKALLIPGIIGAIAGALLLVWADGHGSRWIKPLLAFYTLVLGLRIISRAFAKTTVKKKIKRVGWLAGFGGFLDSFGSGGWGPLVTGTLITKGKTPRFVIGSVSLSEFFVTLASALTFFSAIGLGHWQVILGLTLGGVAAAPLAARLVGRLPQKQLFIGVGCIILIWSIQMISRLF